MIWRKNDDQKLWEALKVVKLTDWQVISEYLGGKFSAEACYSRYQNTLAMKSKWSIEEDVLLFKQVSAQGRNFDLISSSFPEKTTFCCANRFEELLNLLELEINFKKRQRGDSKEPLDSEELFNYYQTDDEEEEFHYKRKKPKRKSKDDLPFSPIAVADVKRKCNNKKKSNKEKSKVKQVKPKEIVLFENFESLDDLQNLKDVVEFEKEDQFLESFENHLDILSLKEGGQKEVEEVEEEVDNSNKENLVFESFEDFLQSSNECSIEGEFENIFEFI
eukprot:gene416-6829_t